MRKITPHGLRRSIKTLLHLKGVDIRNLQDWLGYKNISSTNKYTRNDDKKQVETLETVLQIFDKKENLVENKKMQKKKIVVKKRTFILGV